MEIYQVLKHLLLPPGIILVLLALAFFLVRGTLGRLTLFLAWSLLLIMSLPVFAEVLIRAAERYPALAPEDVGRTGAQAIVVLGAGIYSDAPEYGGDTVDVNSMKRSRYAAWLHRRTGLPIYVAGGAGRWAPGPAIRRFLEQELGVRLAALEEASRSTWENAAMIRPLLDAAGIRRVLLVTDAWHMPRAVQAFERVGVEVVPAPTYFVSGGRRLRREPVARGEHWRNWMPQPQVWLASYYAMYELLGGVYYQLRASFGSSAEQAVVGVDARR
jgi:uncharacterized SAM-binding protein YcdF (DUF218 family)